MRASSVCAQSVYFRGYWASPSKMHSERTAQRTRVGFDDRRFARWGSKRHIPASGLSFAKLAGLIGTSEPLPPQNPTEAFLSPPTVSIANLTPKVAEHYAIVTLARIWQSRGIRVEFGTEYNSEARVCVLHHDRTRLETQNLPRPPANVTVLNGAVHDISKKSYSQLAVTETTRWDGPIIIKSNLNHFGFPESDGCNNRSALMRLRAWLAEKDWRIARMLPRGRYPVLERMDEAPGWVWRDPNLVVEKFLPERTKDGQFGVRGWMFFGDQGYAYRVVSPNPIVKIGSSVRTEYLGEAPAALHEMRQRMKFDFGKFDYVEHGNEIYLLDANKTPTHLATKPMPPPRVLKLSEGIESFLTSERRT